MTPSQQRAWADFRTVEAAGDLGVAPAHSGRPQPGQNVAANLPMPEAVAAEVARYGSLDNAICGLRNDACGAPWGARVHAVLTEALAYQSALKGAA